MPERNDQVQRVGENALAIQAAGNVIINNGITADDARAIAREVWEAEAPRLTRMAEETYRARAAEIGHDAEHGSRHRQRGGYCYAARRD